MVFSLFLGLTFGAAVATAEPSAAKPSEADRAAYETASAAAGRNADAHVALALWCEAHGMSAEKSRHLARAVLLDPSHAKARGLLGLVKHDGKWMRPEEVSRSVEESPEFQALFREYLHRRTEAGDRSDDQYKLARWCDEKGLKQQATAHYHRVIELDPGRDSAWKRLGFKKVSGRWIKPEVAAAAKAEAEAQAKADKHWTPRLEKMKEALSGRDRSKRAEALEAIDRIEDPRVVPAAWRVFALGDLPWQKVALQIFGRIDAPDSSSALALMAVQSPFPEIRSEASQIVLRRDPRHYAGLLIGMLGEVITYKVQEVGGPGSPGRLVIQSKAANVDRRYTPLNYPTLLPGDRIDYDAGGLPFATRTLPSMSFGSLGAAFASALTIPPAQAASSSPLEAALAAGATSGQGSAAVQALSSAVSAIGKGGAAAGSGGGGIMVAATSARIPVGQMIIEARQSAMVAQRQLEEDVRRIDAHNAPIRQLNERVESLLKSASGQDAGTEPVAWMKWFADLQGYALRTSTAEPPPPTFFEDVPVAFQPQAVPIVTTQAAVAYSSPAPQPLPSYGHHCLGAGTKVRTLQGNRPIEEVRAGDEVLSQDTATGALRYRPVVTAYHNPPEETYRLDLGGESIVATAIHKFWKAGHGWIMARDVKPGDRLRTVAGLVEVVAASKDKVQPVFNLQLDGGDDFCVGESGVVTHDNSLVKPVDPPFDAVPTLAALVSLRTP